MLRWLRDVLSPVPPAENRVDWRGKPSTPAPEPPPAPPPVRRHTQPPLTITGHIDGPRLYAMEIVGEAAYQENLRRIFGRYQSFSTEQECVATLVPEVGNPLDSNAVRVQIGALTVGYLSRDRAIEYREILSRRGMAGTVLTVSALAKGGWDRGDGDVGFYGIWLDIPTKTRS